MSRQTMQALRQALDENPSLQAEFAAAATNADILKLAGAAGYPITIDDLALVTEGPSEGGADLSDAELATLSGGGTEVSLDCRPKYPKTWNYCDW